MRAWRCSRPASSGSPRAHTPAAAAPPRCQHCSRRRTASRTLTAHWQWFSRSTLAVTAGWRRPPRRRRAANRGALAGVNCKRELSLRRCSLGIARSTSWRTASLCRHRPTHGAVVPGQRRCCTQHGSLRCAVHSCEVDAAGQHSLQQSDQRRVNDQGAPSLSLQQPAQQLDRISRQLAHTTATAPDAAAAVVPPTCVPLTAPCLRPLESG